MDPRMRFERLCVEGSVLKVLDNTSTSTLQMYTAKSQYWLHKANVGFGNLKFAGKFGPAMFTGDRKVKKIYPKYKFQLLIFIYSNYTFDFFCLSEIHLPYDVKLVK